MSNGSLTIVFGPMGSGKSTRALEQASQYSHLKMNTLYVNHSNDLQRSDKQCYTHSTMCVNTLANLTFVHWNTLDVTEMSKYEVVIIDECQFFPDLHCVLDLVSNGIIVQLYGLVATYEMKKFGSMIDLIPMADHVEHIKSKCTVCFAMRDPRVMINSNAAFTKRITADKEDVVVGDLTLYEPRCRVHM